jgi:hypothetical protein
MYYIFTNPDKYWPFYLQLAAFAGMTGGLALCGILSLRATSSTPYRRSGRRLVLALLPLVLGSWGAWQHHFVAVEANGVTKQFDLCRWFILPSVIGVLAFVLWLFRSVAPASNRRQNNF